MNANKRRSKKAAIMVGPKQAYTATRKRVSGLVASKSMKVNTSWSGTNWWLKLKHNSKRTRRRAAPTLTPSEKTHEWRIKRKPGPAQQIGCHVGQKN